MTDIKDKLLAWGAWSRDFGNQNCLSPSQVLINLAPFADVDELKAARYDEAGHITDCEALRVDKAVGELRTHSERLNAILGYAVDNDDMDIIKQVMSYQIVCMRFRSNYRSRVISSKLNKYFEKQLFNQVNVDKILERAMGFIERDLLDMKIKG